MQTQEHKQGIRIAGIAMNLSRAAVLATLVTWTTLSIGGDNQDSRFGVPVLAETTNNASDPAPGSGEGRIGPTCAQLGEIGSSSRQIEKTLVMGDMVGCGVGSNLA